MHLRGFFRVGAGVIVMFMKNRMALNCYNQSMVSVGLHTEQEKEKRL